MAPLLSSLTVSGNVLALDFDRDLDLAFLSDLGETSQILRRFALQISGRRRDLLSLSANRTQPRRLTLSFTGAVASSDQGVVLDYQDPIGNNTTGVLQNVMGDDLRTFSRHADTLESASNVLALAAGYRHLLLTGAASIGTGNASANSIRVNPARVDNILYGLGGDDVIQASDGNDKLIGGAGNDIMDGGSGSDLYLIERADEHVMAEINDTSADRSTDELRFAATSLVGGSTLTVFAGDIGLETVIVGTGLGSTADSSGTLALNIHASAAANALTITGNAGSNNLVGTRFADVLIGGAGSDVCDGGNGSDIYLVASLSHRPTGEIRDSGSPTDRDELRIAATGHLGRPGEAWQIYPNDTGLERVVVGTGLAAEADTSGIGTIDVSASSAVNALTIIGNNGSNDLTGTAFADWIQGNGGPDVLVGGDGDDTLVGGSGNDQLRGGSGRDAFRFDTPLDPYSADRILDFRAGEDRIQLSRAVFDLPAGSTLSADAFKLGISADRPGQRILYNTTNPGSIRGGLWYDRDGNGSVAPVFLATIDGSPPLSAADVQIVS